MSDAGLALLGPIEEKFVDVTDLYVPKEDGTKDKAFISRGAPLQSDCIKSLGRRVLLLVQDGTPWHPDSGWESPDLA